MFKAVSSALLLIFSLGFVTSSFAQVSQPHRPPGHWRSPEPPGYGEPQPPDRWRSPQPPGHHRPQPPQPPGPPGHHRPQPPPEYHRPPPPPYRGVTQQKTVFLNRWVAYTPIQLGAWFGRLGIDTEIESVEVITRDAQMNSSLALVAYGQLQQSTYQVLGPVMLFPATRISGMDLDRVNLEVRGQIWIEAIKVNYFINAGGRNPGHPGYPGRDIVLDRQIFEHYIGDNYLDLNRYFDLFQMRGMRLVSANIVGSSARGRGTVELQVNGAPASIQYILGTSPSDTLLLNNSPSRMGEDMQSLGLRVRGDITLNRIVLRFSD
jgi:hypothetical protein